MDTKQATEVSPLMDTPIAAAYLGVAAATLETDRCTGRIGIPFIRLGRRIKYRRVDLDQWLDAKAKAAATEGAGCHRKIHARKTHVEAPQ